MTTLATTKPSYTPDDLLAMPDGDRYDLIDGQLVERHMGWDSSWVGGQLYVLLGAYCRSNSVGWAVPADAGYQCFPHAPSRVRHCDVSFVRLGRFPGEHRPRGHCRIPPDMAAEVVSPNDLYSAVEDKVDEYLAVGVRLVWVINPPTRTVRVHRANGEVVDLGWEDELSGEDVIPGFRCRVGDLFANPPGVAGAAPTT